MSKKGIRVLKVSFCIVIVICIMTFATLTAFISSKTESSVVEVSNIYMSEINRQIREKFSSVIGMRVVLLEGISRRTPPGTADNREETLARLGDRAEDRAFASLGFLAEDGAIETVYGEEITLPETQQALGFLRDSGRTVERGESGGGEPMLVLGVEAAYPMENGETSAALIAGIPMKDLNAALFLDENESGMYFHVIDGGGNFVIKNAGVKENNYFSRMRAGFGESDEERAKREITELRGKMAAQEDYFTTLVYQGEKKHVYFSPVFEGFDWYLVAVMPEDVLSGPLFELGAARAGAVIVSILVIVLSMFVVFLMYYQMMRRQMKALAKSQSEAVHANQAKSEFLSSMSHDIRTPMNAIIGMTEIAMRNTQDAERTQEYLKKIKLSSNHLLGLINDVLDMAKIESGKMNLNENALSLRNVMDDLVNIMQPQVREKRQHFDIFIRDIAAEDVKCDAVRLNQVLINTLSNAVKFTPEEGMISVHVSQEASPKGEEYVRTHFIVEDTGIGMSEEFQKRIWKTFEREESELVQQVTGTGLGMSITKSIVDLMGGTIELQSELYKGSRFHIILDFKKAAVREENMRLPSWDVLVVDDNELLCTSAAANLEELGVHAEWTTDGGRAVELIKERYMQGKEYHFILVDWKMPGMDGIETIRKIRGRMKKQVPIFLVSAYDLSDIEEKISDLSGVEFISKPLFKSTLFERLSRYADGYDEKCERREETREEAVFSGKRVLLAEDIDINWEVAYELLSSTGLAIERAVNGKECVEMMEASEIGYYDAILMDIRMPVMDGYDATRRIRALTRTDKDLPIIAMTADAFTDDAEYCMSCGMNGHLAKPIDLKACIRLLQQFLG
ncbi:MAG: response regulator [Lachnospiraceae bacterium]|nr:response regulator [Lachnospiraceae bacterium]